MEPADISSTHKMLPITYLHDILTVILDGYEYEFSTQQIESSVWTLQTLSNFKCNNYCPLQLTTIKITSHITFLWYEITSVIL